MRAKRQTTAPTRFFLRPGSSISERLRARNAGLLRRWLTRRGMRRLYAQTDGVIAVSECIAEDVIQITGIDPARVHVVRNPNITPELYELAAAPLNHPWFAAGEPPVLLGIGGLRKAKDFPTLLRAFAGVLRQRRCRLMILGQGHMQKSLLGLARELGIADHVAMPGFVENPYAYLSRASLFVLSSVWEGSPNVLTEALALGTPVVATDCRCGPGEITQHGKYGALVPVGDADALGRAILKTLDAPRDAEWLKTAVQDYTMNKSAAAYIAAMGLDRTAAGQADA
jgi:glycosyltransferase involved in cell wall biosynthesis